MKYVASTIFFIFSLTAHAENKIKNVNCEKLDDYASLKGAFIPGHMNVRKVIGEGRLYFNSAPSKFCIDKKTFIIPKDEAIAYREYEGYTYIMYINPKSNMEFLGWVLSNRLLETGTGIAPRQVNGGYE